MKARLLAAAGAAVLLASAASAHAETFDWSFTDVNTGTTVAGTISGLQEGVNDTAAPYVVDVTQSSDPTTLGMNYIVDPSQFSTGPNEFIVSNGQVTYASVEFDQTGTDTNLYFGTNSECNGNSGNTYCPELYSDTLDQLSPDQPDIFKNVDVAVSAAPEPGAWALMLGGVAAMGLALRNRRRQAKLARVTA